MSNSGWQGSRAASLKGPDWLRTMDDGQYVDLIRFNVVGDSKWPFKNLANLWDFKFRNLASRQWEFRNLPRAPSQAVNNP
jgi:hypothetical protein